MPDSKTAAEWARLGISKSWYYSIKSRKQAPSMELALRIYDQTGERYGFLFRMSDDEIGIVRKAMHNSDQSIANCSDYQLEKRRGDSRRASPANAPSLGGLPMKHTKEGK